MRTAETRPKGRVRASLGRGLVAAAGIFLALVFAGGAGAVEPPVVRLLTTNQESVRVTGSGPNVNARRPGWLIELLGLVAERAGVEFEIKRHAWKKVLKLVETGEADGAFVSSYRPERAVYGVYPTKDGALDPSRALLNYAYWLYAPTGSGVAWNGVSFGGLDKPIGAELNASVVPALKKAGAAVVEAETYHEILAMLDEGRVSAVAGFEDNVDIFLRTAPERYRNVVRHPVPLVRKTGYLMFSKSFHAKNKALAEKIWDAVEAVWLSPKAAEIRRNYE